MKAKLTDKQLRAYCFMQDFFRENDMLPTNQIVALHFGNSSANGGWALMKQLERKGWIEPNGFGKKYRFAREQEPA